MSDLWHWEVEGEGHHSPILWALVSWLVILATVGYLAWEWVR